MWSNQTLGKMIIKLQIFCYHEQDFYEERFQDEIPVYFWHEARHEKRCDPVILDLGQILEEMWTFLPKQRVILMNPEFVDFGQTRSTSQNISGLFSYTFICG